MCVYLCGGSCGSSESSGRVCVAAVCVMMVVCVGGGDGV